jgi:N6-L-threonylcarbamoyladenine synthase/protein kinase Bud32
VGALTRKFCLGLESTAHTFGAGVVSFSGEVLSVVNDTYVPKSGGLHPREVAEHHMQNFGETLQKALAEAKISWQDINLIAFSQGPGLGPCLRVGATVARALHFSLKVPLVGVNHCVAHVEIGRLSSNVEDPLTLYVSGGNTIVSAFEAGRYRIFGETLDLAVGNMIDMFARDAGLPHPGGPKIEKLAKSSNTFLPLPYVVKGMDLSFSGLLTAAKNLLQGGKSIADVSFSLQEVAFAMLTEVTERALAHTKKKDVLLTGGVAANQRLQSMIKWIADNQGARFHVVPLRLAGDNGAMIAWSGIEQFRTGGPMVIEATTINPKIRMDEVPIPWRT